MITYVRDSWREFLLRMSISGQIAYENLGNTGEIKMDPDLRKSHINVLQELTEKLNSREVELQYNQELIKDVLNILQDPVAVIGSKGEFLNVNDSFLSMIGGGREGVIKQKLDMLSRWFDVKLLRSLYLEAKQTKTKREKALKTKRIVATPLLDKQDDFYGIILQIQGAE